ncbi:MAG TPA: hypothetical protein VF014_04595, partial [Casimicrobiaceae bacterium]|nr:hypothetical protein [Casimicrobiaceae bacterium]
GAIVRVRSSIAVRMVLAGEALPVFVDDAGAPPSGTLVAAIRAALRSDAELYALLVGARAYAFTMPAGRMCGDGRANACAGSSAVCRERLCPAPTAPRDSPTRSAPSPPAAGMPPRKRCPSRPATARPSCWRITVAVGGISCEAAIG